MTTTVGFPPAPLHQVGGHEGIGRVVAFGPDTHGSTPLEIGDRVGVKWVAYICGVCMSCLSGHDALCEKVRVSGFGTPGTFQEYVVSPASYVTPIPEGLESEVAAPMLCGGVTVYAALRKSGAQPVSLLGGFWWVGRLLTLFGGLGRICGDSWCWGWVGAFGGANC